ncbi:hypothetical protein BH11ACT2_BH11ACT2_09120 [soil metagenome]
MSGAGLLPEEFDDDEDIVTEPLTDLIDTDGFAPRQLALLSNALVWRESFLLRREFNLGTNDWRVISVLAARPGSSSTEIADFIGMNKAVVSKAMNTLIDRDLIVANVGPYGSRPLFLTREGAEMHGRMKPISSRGEEIILEGLDEHEIAQLKSLLARLISKIPALSSVPDVAAPRD